MTATKYDYSIQNDFPQHLVSLDRLGLEIKATALTSLYDYGDTSGDVCSLWFTSALDQDQVQTLLTVIAVHSGAPVTQVIFHASSSLVGSLKEMTSQDWEDVGGVVTNVGFFVENIQMALGRVVGQIKSQGAGAQLRICKQDGTVILGSVALADTQGAWENMSITSNPGMALESFEALYIVQARLNGATALAFRYTSFTLLEIMP